MVKTVTCLNIQSIHFVIKYLLKAIKLLINIFIYYCYLNIYIYIFYYIYFLNVIIETFIHCCKHIFINSNKQKILLKLFYMLSICN